MKKSISHKTVSWIIGGVFFLGAFILSAPASLIPFVLNKASADFRYQHIEGTIWSGAMAGASLNDVYLGDIDYKTSLAPLLLGRARVEISARGDDIFGKGTFSAGLLGSLKVKKADFHINLTSATRRYDFLGTPIEGLASVKIDELHYTKKGCKAAKGAVWTDVLHGTARAFEREAFDLEGPLACNDGALRLALKGSGDEGSADLFLAIKSNLQYTLKAEVQPNRDEFGATLRQFGFEKSDNGLIYGSKGVFKGV